MTLISKGVYDLRFAARVLREEPRTLRRWAFGYRRRGVDYQGVIPTELPVSKGEAAITFHELIELLFIAGFRESGLPFTKIREALEVAQRLFGTEHPFAMKNWFVDPAGLYAEIRSQSGDPVLVELAGDAQIAIKQALHPHIRQLDFARSGIARRWFPRGRDVPIVMDPELAMGSPVINGTAVPTQALSEFYTDDDSIDELAWWYDLQPGEVAAAVRFEQELAAA